MCVSLLLPQRYFLINLEYLLQNLLLGKSRTKKIFLCIIPRRLYQFNFSEFGDAFLLLFCKFFVTERSLSPLSSSKSTQKFRANSANFIRMDVKFHGCHSLSSRILPNKYVIHKIESFFLFDSSYIQDYFIHLFI